ncbi:MAG: hypothetical protein AAF383_26435 [Cyanobacteria bacterium P01_A01_bin.83]
MIISDLPYLKVVSQGDQIVGGQQKDSFDNKAVALSLAYADGSESYAVAGTSIYIDRGFSRSSGFAVAQSRE